MGAAESRLLLVHLNQELATSQEQPSQWQPVLQVCSVGGQGCRSTAQLWHPASASVQPWAVSSQLQLSYGLEPFSLWQSGLFAEVREGGTVPLGQTTGMDLLLSTPTHCPKVGCLHVQPERLQRLLFWLSVLASHLFLWLHTSANQAVSPL